MPNYGDIWSAPGVDLARITNEQKDETAALTAALKCGYFTQFTSYSDTSFVSRVVDWYVEYLKNEFHLDVDTLPPEISEHALAPVETVVNRGGRPISPDLLRNVAYVSWLNRFWRQSGFQPKTIIEIGGGHGAFSRAIKLFYPQTQVLLIDIPESLRFAQTYLKTAFPDSHTKWVSERVVDASEALGAADFCFLPVDYAGDIAKGQFDLAVNIWSFGEMTNEYVSAWMGAIQKKLQVSWLFTVNSFMAPVTPDSIRRAGHGDWLSQLDNQWNVVDFEISPGMHCCPWIKNFPKGVGLIARKFLNDREESNAKLEAARSVIDVFAEDWAVFSATPKVIETAHRPELAKPLDPGAGSINLLSADRVRTVTDYIGHFEIEAGMDGSFFKLWNHYRLNNSEEAAALLVIFLCMTGKSDPKMRCNKEEIFYLRRLLRIGLHDEYSPFFPGRQFAHDANSVVNV